MCRQSESCACSLLLNNLVESFHQQSVFLECFQDFDVGVVEEFHDKFIIIFSIISSRGSSSIRLLDRFLELLKCHLHNGVRLDQNLNGRIHSTSLNGSSSAFALGRRLVLGAQLITKILTNLFPIDSLFDGHPFVVALFFDKMAVVRVNGVDNFRN